MPTTVHGASKILHDNQNQVFKKFEDIQHSDKIYGQVSVKPQKTE